MCGIAGILNLENTTPVSEDLLLRMVSILRHRGPDESGIYWEPQIGLGHARLSIIGLDGGTQPIGNEDGSLWIVYNGEAFNYPELREELRSRGHRFTTGTDTEVVLHLYEEWGPRCLERINGQFALAIWDANRGELFLARDRVGVRPLYFTRAGGQLLFASEIKALFLHPEIRREIDPQALAQVFTFWTTLPSRTVFRGVQEVPPGHYLLIRDGLLTEKAWWQLSYCPPEERRPATLPEAREELAALLADAVRLRLRADVPVGSYLSGGLDSSILSILAAGELGEAGLRTFSLRFAESSFDETPFQQEMVRFLATDHRELRVAGVDLRRHLAEVVWHCEKPLLRTSPIPLFLLSRLVRDSGLKVVLTGEGADEVFGGYNIFKEAKVRHYWSLRPQSHRRPRLLERLYPYVFLNPGRERYFLQKFFSVQPGGAADPCFSHQIRWGQGRRLLHLFSAEAGAALTGYEPLADLVPHLPPDFSDRDLLSRAQWLEVSIFLSNYLLSSQGDRVAMAHSLELRHPFLDYRLIDFALRLPAFWKLRALQEKYLLKTTFRHRLPAGVVRRPKQPYRAPIRELFLEREGNTLLDHVMSEETVREAGIFDPTRVDQLLRRFRENPGPAGEWLNMAVAGIATSQLLHHQFVRGAFLPIGRTGGPDLIVRRSLSGTGTAVRLETLSSGEVRKTA